MPFGTGTSVRVAPGFPVLLHTLTERDLGEETLTVAGRKPNGVTVLDSTGALVKTRQGTKLVSENDWLVSAE